MHLPFHLEPKRQSCLYVKVILQVINLVFSSRLGSESVATTHKSNHSSSRNWSQNYRMILTLISSSPECRPQKPTNEPSEPQTDCNLQNLQIKTNSQHSSNTFVMVTKNNFFLKGKIRKEKRKWHVLITVCPCQPDFGRFGIMTVHHSTLNSSQPCRQRLMALTNSPFGTPEFIAALSAAQSVLYINNLMMLALD